MHRMELNVPVGRSPLHTWSILDHKFMHFACAHRNQLESSGIWLCFSSPLDNNSHFGRISPSAIISMAIMNNTDFKIYVESIKIKSF